MITPVEKRGRRRKQARAKSQRDKRMFFMMAEAPPYVDEIMKVIKSNKNPSQRLSKFFKFKNDKLIAAYVTFLLEIAREAEPDKDWCESNFTLENKDVYGLHAVAALDLDPDEIADVPIIDTFRKANLDPKNPVSWRVLMMFLCWSHFPPKRAVGSKRKWITEDKCKLLREVYEARPKHHHPTRWVSAACVNLSKKKIFRHKNKPLSAPALRAALTEARNPERNYALGRLIDETKRVLKEDHERRGHVWPPIHLEDALARVQTIEQALRDNNGRVVSSDVKTDSIEFDYKDETACFDLRNELRTRDHDDLLKELLAADAPFHHFLLKFLENRRTSDRGAFKETLVRVNGYDSFLKVVEDVIAADHRAALEAVMDNALKADRGDMSDAIVLASETFIQADIAHDRKREEAISKVLSEFYCKQLEVGGISLSQAMARAGLITRADLLGEPFR